MMNKYQCLVVDDESIAQRILVGYLNEIPGMEVVGTALNAMEAMSILESKSVDLMFLDIEMPKLKGLAFLTALKNPPHVIITTAHREYALQGFDLEVVDYLLKPISFERFLKAINRFKKSSRPNNDKIILPKELQYIYVKSERKTLKINTTEIRFIEAMNNYIILHVHTQRHIVYRSMTDILKELDNDFVRIHKSYVVNKQHVKGFTKEQVLLGAKELPIGKAYRDAVKRL